jgi:CDP-4-dehydro-6-deoxyglucose reductase
MTTNKVTFKNFSAQVISKRELTTNVILLAVRPLEEISYEAGQYFSFKIEDKVNRSYSTLSAPHEENIEFLIDTAPGGIGSKFVEELKVGQEFDLMGPFGFFTTQKTKSFEAESLIFIATGSGIVPMRSMIVDLLQYHNFQKPIQLYFGLRYDNTTYLFDELSELETKYANFKFIPVISRPSESWNGASGYCQDIVKNMAVIPNAKIYVCGRTETVKSITESLIEHGYGKEQVFFEKFG